MEPGDEKALVLLSGGMDSVTLLHYARARMGYAMLCALSFDYGQKHARELEMARWQAEAAGVAWHRTVDLSFLKCMLNGGSALTDETIPVPPLSAVPPADRVQPPTYVPNRNMVLLSVAAACAEAGRMGPLLYGAHRQDAYGYWDCTREFVGRLNGVLSLNRRRPVRVQAPFIDMRKADIVKIGLDLKVDYARTWSCYRGQAEACGECPTCVERLAAFREAGVTDPLPYPRH
ncbi:MAG: 7-cyano-7-deazaguanine synthase QueC [Kiritimatiellae bacterium]|nr:7-cyano-7-deazaguanine synthase QueC [Kiritimatiellia bacterium]